MAERPTDHLVWKRTDVDGRPASYGEAGEGQPLVFMHGWGLAHHSYKRAMKRLVRLGLKVFAPALPGFGGSADLPKEKFSMDGYADWAAQFMEAVGIAEPAYVVGHSFGGGVGIKLAHKHPEKVHFLVLINSVGGSVWTKDGSIVKQMKERPIWDWGIHFPADILPVGQLRRVLPVLLEDALPNVVRNPRAMIRVAGLARSADLRQELEELKEREMPVVVLWGDKDRIITEDSFRDLCLAIGAEGDVIPGAHNWLLSDPDAFGEVITNVLAVAQVARRQKEKEAAAARKGSPAAAGDGLLGEAMAVSAVGEGDG